jgi:hypothetical protein
MPFGKTQDCGNLTDEKTRGVLLFQGNAGAGTGGMNCTEERRKVTDWRDGRERWGYGMQGT